MIAGKLLLANRREIAIRTFRTTDELGLPRVAVFPAGRPYASSCFAAARKRPFGTLPGLCASLSLARATATSR